MNYDVGALAKFPNQSPTFRFLSNPNLRRSQTWPTYIQQQMCVFFHTPGVSNRWTMININQKLGQAVKESLAYRHPDWVKLGSENGMSATYDDALRYIQRSPGSMHMPIWAIPYMLADVKSLGSQNAFKIWGHPNMRKVDFLNFGV